MNFFLKKIIWNSATVQSGLYFSLEATFLICPNSLSLPSLQNSLLCILALSYSDVFCGLLLCANLDGVPRIGHLQGEIIPTSFFHQGVVVNCRYVKSGSLCNTGFFSLPKNLNIKAHSNRLFLSKLG